MKDDFLAQLKQNNGGMTAPRERMSSYRTIAVTGYPDAETVNGVEVEITPDGLAYKQDKNGHNIELSFKLSKDIKSDRPPRISAIRTSERGWEEYVNRKTVQFQQLLDGNPDHGLEGELYDNLLQVMEDRMSFEGALKKSTKIVQHGGILQFDGVSNKGTHFEASWMKTLSRAWGESVVVPQGDAMIHIHPVSISVDNGRGKTYPVIGAEAVDIINRLSPTEAEEKANISVDILLTRLAKTTRNNVAALMSEQFDLLSNLGVGKSAAIMTRIFAPNDPAHPISISTAEIGAEPIEGVLNDDGSQKYKLRDTGSAVHRIFNTPSGMTKPDGEPMNRGELFERALEHGAIIEVTPLIKTSQSKLAKQNIIKNNGTMRPGDALMTVCTGEFIPDLDEEGNQKFKVGSDMSGETQIPIFTYQPRYTYLQAAALSRPMDQDRGVMLKNAMHMPATNKSMIAIPVGVYSKNGATVKPMAMMGGSSNFLDSVRAQNDQKDDLSDMPAASLSRAPSSNGFDQSF